MASVINTSSVKTGRKPKENNPNLICRLCKCSLLVKFGNTSKSCENLFKPSSREGSRGVVLSSLIENVYGKPFGKVTGLSEVVCNSCGRKIKTLFSFFEIVKQNY